MEQNQQSEYIHQRLWKKCVSMCRQGLWCGTLCCRSGNPELWENANRNSVEYMSPASVMKDQLASTFCWAEKSWFLTLAAPELGNGNYSTVSIWELLCSDAIGSPFWGPKKRPGCLTRRGNLGSESWHGALKTVATTCHRWSKESGPWISGGFLKWWYPQVIDRWVFHCKASIKKGVPPPPLFGKLHIKIGRLMGRWNEHQTWPWRNFQCSWCCHKLQIRPVCFDKLFRCEISETRCEYRCLTRTNRRQTSSWNSAVQHWKFRKCPLCHWIHVCLGLRQVKSIPTSPAMWLFVVLKRSNQKNGLSMFVHACPQSMVDGRNPAPADRWFIDVYPIICRLSTCFNHPRWCRIVSYFFHPQYVVMALSPRVCHSILTDFDHVFVIDVSLRTDPPLVWNTSNGPCDLTAHWVPGVIKNWLVVWNIFYFPIYWVANHPNWLIFFRGVQTTNLVILDDVSSRTSTFPKFSSYSQVAERWISHTSTQDE